MGKVFSSSYYKKEEKNEKKFKFKPWHLFALCFASAYAWKIYFHFLSHLKFICISNANEDNSMLMMRFAIYFNFNLLSRVEFNFRRKKFLLSWSFAVVKIFWIWNVCSIFLREEVINFGWELSLECSMLINFLDWSFAALRIF